MLTTISTCKRRHIGLHLPESTRRGLERLSVPCQCPRVKAQPSTRQGGNLTSRVAWLEKQGVKEEVKKYDVSRWVGRVQEK